VKKRGFGPSQIEVPIIGQGTWKMENDGTRARCVSALRKGIDLGMTHIDTAEMYGDGVVEEIVGEAIAGRRERVFLVSKVLPYNASRTGTMQACEKSLKRLRTDHLDVYLLHWRGDIPLEETVEALESLVKQGKIKSWGVSNFDVDDIDELFTLKAGANCVCNQVLLHLEKRYAAGTLLDVCRDASIALVGYSPLAQGTLPGKRKVLDQIAKAHNTTAESIALAFLAHDDGVFLIPKSSTLQHVEQNAKSADIVLSDAELKQLNAAFPITGRRLSFI
jgi:diketogulonate reductase-like aldo/keto reductase